MSRLLLLLIHILSKVRRVLIAILLKYPSKISNILIHGMTIKIDSNNPDGTTQALLHPDIKFDNNELKIWSILSKKANIILDIGANIGIYSLVASISNPNSIIYSFEPNKFNIKKLNSNIDLNKLTNINIVSLAVGSVSKAITFYIPSGNKPTSVSSTNRKFMEYWHSDIKEIEVNQVSIDDWVKQTKIQQIDLIKLDVENYELFVLKGAYSSLLNWLPTIIIELHLIEIINQRLKEKNAEILEETTFEIHALLTSIGYTLYSIGKFGLLKLTSVISDEENLNFLYSKYVSNSYYVPYDSDEINYF